MKLTRIVLLGATIAPGRMRHDKTYGSLAGRRATAAIGA